MRCDPCTQDQHGQCWEAWNDDNDFERVNWAKWDHRCTCWCRRGKSTGQ